MGSKTSKVDLVRTALRVSYSKVYQFYLHL